MNSVIYSYLHSFSDLDMYSIIYVFNYLSLAIPLMVDKLSYLSFQPVLHDWCNKGRGMCYPVCGVVHIKITLGKSSGSGFPLSLS